MTDRLRRALFFFLPLTVLPMTANPASAQDRSSASSAVPPLAELLVLPQSSDPELDAMLAGMEKAYNEMDVDGWVSYFTEDVEQVDVPRRVHVVGREAWRAQTGRINASHVEIGRIHHGRARIGNWVVVEVEWSGRVRGAALGTPGQDKTYHYGGLALLEMEGEKVRRQIIYGDVTTLNEQLRGH